MGVKKLRIEQIIGKKMRKARQRLGLSQEILAERIGIKRATLSRYEAGSGDMKIGILMDCTGPLKVNIGDLIPNLGRDVIDERDEKIKEVLDIMHNVKRDKTNECIAKTAKNIFEMEKSTE